MANKKSPLKVVALWRWLKSNYVRLLCVFLGVWNRVSRVPLFMWHVFINLLVWAICVIVCVVLVVYFTLLSFPIISIVDRFLYGVRNKKKSKRPVVMPSLIQKNKSLSLHSELYHDYLELEANFKVHYVSIGLCRDHPLMLFLHGFPECWYSWRHQMLRFWEDYTVVAVDMRGYNLTSRPVYRSSYGMSFLVQDIKAIIEKLNYKKGIIVGHDWGGAVAWSFAYKYPEMVERLIVLNMPHPVVVMKNVCFNRKHIARCWFIYFFQLPFFPERQITQHNAGMVWNLFRKHVVHPQRMSNSDIAIFQEALLRESSTSRAVLNYYRNLFTLSSLWMGINMQHKLETNTLLIWGVKDNTLDFRLCEESMSYVKHGKVVRILESSHYPQQDTPTEVNETIARFLSLGAQQSVQE